MIGPGSDKNIGRKKKFGPQRRERTKKEKEVNIWRREIFGPRRRKRMDTEKEENIWTRKILREGKYLVRRGDKE